MTREPLPPLLHRLRKPDRCWLLLTALTALALLPLTAPGYFYTAHDGRHSVFFVTMFDEAVRDGALWPIWAMHHNQGYGYPTFLIQAPLAFYVAEFFVLGGMGITAAVKCTWAVAFLLSGWGMYGWVRHWATCVVPGSTTQSGALAGLLAGLLYVYAPYHLLDIYVRAALAETMLIGWLPWVFWAFDCLIVGGNSPGWQRRMALAALAYTGLILTHAFALLAVTPLLAAYLLFRLWLQKRHLQLSWTVLAPRAASVAAAGMAGVLGAAVFLVPLLLEGPLLSQEIWVSDTYNYARHYVHFGQFFSPFWGYGYSDDPAGANDGMGFQIGLLLISLGIVAITILPTFRGLYQRMVLFWAGSSLISLYWTTAAAGWIWEAVPPMAILQFPWRLLTLAIFTFSALAGLILCSALADTTQASTSALLFGMAVVLASSPYLRPAAYDPVEPWREDGRAVFEFERSHPDMLGYTTLVQERFTETALTPQYASALLLDTPLDTDRLERLEIVGGTGTVIDHYSRGHHFGGRVVMSTPGTIQIRLYAFPGWQIQLNDRPVTYQVSQPHGLMEIDVTAGAHRIDVHMGSTPPRTAGLVLSTATLLTLLAFWAQGTRHNLFFGKPAGHMA